MEAIRITAGALGPGAFLILGNLAARLHCGIAPGRVHERDAAELLVCDSESTLANLGAERRAAVGVLSGAVLAAAAVLALAQLGADAAPRPFAAALLTDAYGAAIAGVIGSCFGLTPVPARVRAAPRRNVPTNEPRD